MKLEHAEPRTAVMDVLTARYGDVPASTARDDLARFQSDAVSRLSRILAARRGAILADSVGLGKTHVARAIAADCIAGGDRVLVCAPAQLRRHWTRHMKGLSGWSWLSHTSLSRGNLPRMPCALAVIDEAHAFRNPATRRYLALSRIARHAKLLLLTATPVNNDMDDFYHLVRLFAARADFADVGVPDLLFATEAARAGDSAAIRRVAEAVVVRRTRAALRVWGFDDAVRFPRLDGIQAVRYDLDNDSSRALEELLTRIQALRFPAHAVGGGAVSPDLLRFGLLKRLESSVAALDASAARHLRILLHFHAAAAAGLLFVPRHDAQMVRDVDGAMQLALSELMLRAWPPHVDRVTALAETVSAIARLRDLRACAALLRDDAKIARLHELLRDRAARGKVVVFTEYRETALHLWRALYPHFAVGMIHGGASMLGRSRAARTTVVERFAPIANGARPPRARERVDVLIATDVLAEGMNLQDARMVVSYDLPWNPVRLAQRVGRIDRLGSPHASIEAYAFRPGVGLEAMLGLVRRLRRKIRQIEVVGGDAPRLRSPRRRHDDDAHAVAAESLRRAFADEVERSPREIVRDERTSPGTASTKRRRRGAFLAAAVHPQGMEAILTAWRVGSAVRYFVSDTSGARELPVTEADPLLLCALHASAGVPPAESVVRIALRRARMQLRGTAGRFPARHADTGRQLAHVVRRWLRGQPMGATPQQIELAERVLAGARSLDSAAELELQRSLRSAPPGEVVERAGQLLRAAPCRPAGAPGTARRGFAGAPGESMAPPPALLAVIAFVPSPSPVVHRGPGAANAVRISV